MIAKGTVEERVRLYKFQKRNLSEDYWRYGKPSALAEHFSSLENLIQLSEV